MGSGTLTDIGFGLVDRRTVIVVLSTMVLAQIIFQFKIPVDTTNIATLSIDLFLLTGYLYFARCVYRLPVALIGAVALIVLELRSNKESESDAGPPGVSTEEDKDNQTQSAKISKPSISRRILSGIGRFLLRVIAITVGLPLFLSYLVITFGEWIEQDNPVTTSLKYSSTVFSQRLGQFLLWFFGTLDRIGVVLIAALATYPPLSQYVRTAEVAGLVLLIVIFTFRGDFSSLVKDFIKKRGEDRPQIEVANSYSNPLYVKVVKEPSWD